MVEGISSCTGCGIFCVLLSAYLSFNNSIALLTNDWSVIILLPSHRLCLPVEEVISHPVVAGVVILLAPISANLNSLLFLFSSDIKSY